MSALPSYIPSLEDQWLDIFLQANEAGIKLEIVGREHTWEAFPGFLHQEQVDRIRASIKRISGDHGDCACIHAADVYVAFPDGSIKRPDVSIFCTRPQEMEGFIRQIPKAVIEVISKGNERKDLEDGPKVYLAQGVLDVVVFDPQRNKVHHFDATGEHVHASPVTLDLKCGCQVTA